jgi:PDZ domain-containing protein
MTSTVAAATAPRLTRNVDTTDPMLTGAPEVAATTSPPEYGWGPSTPPSPPPPTPPPPPGAPDGRPRWLVPAVVALSVFVVAALAGLFVRLPYDSIAPGSARRVDDLISVKDHAVYPPAGRLLFTTVSVREGINAWEALAGWLDSSVDVVSEKAVRGSVPADQYHQENVAAMADSKTAAEAVALRHVGFTDLGGGAEIVSVKPGLPASAVLKVKDVVVSIDGKPVAGPADLIPVVRTHRPGDSVHLGVVRGDAAATDVPVTLADDKGQPLIGVLLSTKLKLPFQIGIDSGTVEGPSAGLAYSLALLDTLTPGELTGGAKVAATGELASDGTVGAIGGVAQKVVAVRHAGAAVFLVPRENYREAKAHAGSKLKVVAIDDYDDALRALAALPGSNAAGFAQVGGAQS